jgi:broad specificity phosphatase PhoE
MKPKRIILVRHGESEGNADSSLYETTPDYALKLTQQGVLQAREAGKEIKSLIGDEGLHVYLSPFFRARETFKYIQESIGGNVTKAIEDPRIREQDWGHLRHPNDNKGIITARDEFSTFYYRIPDGESGADVYDRVTTFLDTLHRDFKKENYPDNILIVSHGLTIRLFLMRWFHWSVEEFESIHNPKNCQIIIMEKQINDHYTLISDLTRKP